MPGTVAAFIPTFVADVAGAFDPYRRDTKADGWLEAITTAGQARMPYFRNQLPAQIDVFGRPLPQSPFTLFDFTLSQPAQERTDPMLKALLDTDVGVGWPAKKPGETQAQWRERAITVGQAIEAELRRVVAQPGFADLSLDERRKRLERAIDRGRDVARGRSGPPPGRR